ncbi:MAG: ABC transporter ATP-binding protein/permease [Lachnospiraceae bacterium]|nr:ABC transporter ATP-binding protein/permease [Lachnospiraceae bacterium]
MKKQTVRRVLSYLGHQKLFLTLSLLLSALSVVCSLYVPLLLGDAIDGIIGKGNVDFDLLRDILPKAAVLIGISAVASWITATINNAITFRVVKEIREEFFEKITRVPVSYLDSRENGDLLSRMITDVDQFSDGLLMGFSQFFTGVVTILGTLFCMVLKSPLIAGLVVVLTPASLFLAKFIAGRTFKLFREQAKVRSEQTGLIDEMVGNRKVVTAFSHEEESLEAFREVNDRLTHASLRATFFSSLTNPSTRIINNTVYAVVTFAGALSVIAGRLTVGSLSALLGYAGQYAKPFNEISGVITELQNALACAGRVFDVLSYEWKEPAEESVSDFVPEGRVTAEHVAFSYRPDRPLIRDMNIDVKPGAKIALVGPTGCGKTTMINLLMRFYDVNSGVLSVDGTDIRTIPKPVLRKQFGMVLQDTWLAEGSIRENICMGRPDATEEEMIAAAKASHAHSFIRRLPQGYDTVLSHGGEELSAGQKQLLCIARVMLALPPMLILDEATSSIDTRTELKIQDAFQTMMKGRTTFIVAHRLSTIRNANCILVMKDGDIIEQGSHDELMEKGGFYKELVLAGRNG